MSYIVMPQLGESVTEGTIGKWFKKVGDSVEKYEPLAEVMTDKVNAEIPSEFTGILTEILIAEGKTVPVGTQLAVIQTEREKPSQDNSTQEKSEHNQPSTAVSHKVDSVQEKDTSIPVEVGLSQKKPIENAPSTNMRFSPAVSRMLSEYQIDPQSITGTGLGGRITRKDVLAYVEATETGSISSTSQAPTNQAESNVEAVN